MTKTTYKLCPKTSFFPLFSSTLDQEKSRNRDDGAMLEEIQPFNMPFLTEKVSGK